MKIKKNRYHFLCFAEMMKIDSFFHNDQFVTYVEMEKQAQLEQQNE